ncbi:MAG: putative tail fiber protein [Prokaryotic dsDNA virus sp.]|nr:MAG: putative tail fiber protein [Prokaryotic dsDNA virus sp.]QDP60076.1 MAG: putative tail fiber protein [Prokaryotic dsDNA virus sp.]QDP67097.1 MAG: putative tail fiber protein [Prokaryotic dsDNA virus sp.]|tara:strand:+ start:33778 stop:36378 length:2601 start_codon:yes stop_codon:yes gene_type:complete
MTITTTIAKNSYSGNGSTTVFAYQFKILAQGDLQVILRSSTGTETVQEITTHYSVSGVGSATGGNVTFGSAPASGVTVVIRRATTQTQTVDLVENDPFTAETVETAFDRSIILAQELQEQVDRSLKISRTNTMTSTDFTTSATDRANKVLAFDSSGELAVTQEIGTFKGNWAASTTYAVRDIVKDTSTNNIFIAKTAHTSSGSQPLTTNTDSGKWDLLVDAASATTSQNAAATSATAAASSATAAASSASTASGHKDTATTQASNASTSASNAASSATAAASSATAAAASLDSFDDVYLGAKSSDPSVDNDGDALAAGALYFNTSSDALKYYTGSTWVAITATTTISDLTDTNITSPADGSLLLYDTGTSKYIDNVISGDATLADTGALTIANDAITGAKIADDAINSEHYTDGSIDTAHIADLNVTQAKIANEAINEAKLQVSNSPVNGYMLTAQSGNTGGLTWAEAPSGGGFSLASALSGTTPTIDWSSATAFSQTLAANTTYSFSNVPSGGEIELFLKNVGKTHDFLSLNAATNEDFDGQKGNERIKGSLFNNDGTKFYLAGEDGSYSIHQYSLSTAYDVSTASYDSKVSPSFGSSVRIHGLHFNGDGTALIAAQGNDLYEYTLTGAYDISTVSGTANHSIVMDTPLSLDSSAHAYFVNIRFNANGTLAYLGNMRHSGQSSYATTKSGFIISLSTAYDIDSTLTLLSTFDYGADEYFKTAASNVYSDIAYDGTAIVAVEETVASGVSRVHKYYLTTPWDLSTASHIGSADITTANSNATNIYNVRTTPNGKFFFYNEYQSGNADNAIVRNYDIVGNFEVALPSSVSSLPAAFGDGPDPSTTSYLRLVSLDGSNVLITDHKEIV